MDWNQFLSDLSDLLANIPTGEQPEYGPFFAALAKLFADAQPSVPPPLGPAFHNVRTAIPTANNPTARDWAGFFAALASFAATILPLIAPLFAKPATT